MGVLGSKPTLIVNSSHSRALKEGTLSGSTPVTLDEDALAASFSSLSSRSYLVIFFSSYFTILSFYALINLISAKVLFSLARASLYFLSNYSCLS